ncbi:MAG TPA: hypothetical protein VMD25_08515 [Acidobacteriaceae bacterium]|nr:hypothetical protein [Acidobacteriaceae bacterium]
MIPATYGTEPASAPNPATAIAPEQKYLAISLNGFSSRADIPFRETWKFLRHSIAPLSQSYAIILFALLDVTFVTWLCDHRRRTAAPRCRSMEPGSTGKEPRC